VAFDVLGSGVGERVLVAQGSVAAAWFPGKPPPIDALIIGSVDEPAAAAPAAGGPARRKGNADGG
jgi:ethanolamine utilization protein EutN